MKMGRALLILGVLGLLGFVVTGILGYGLVEPGYEEMPRHMLLGLASCLLLLFSQLWLLFYLAGVHRAIRRTVEELRLEPRLSEEARRLRRAYPWLVLALVTSVTTFLIGALVATMAVPPWVHHALFFVALVAQALALWQGSRALTDSEALVAAVDRASGPASAPVAEGVPG